MSFSRTDNNTRVPSEYLNHLGDRWHRSWLCGCSNHALDRSDVDIWLEPLTCLPISSDEMLLDVAFNAEGELLQCVRPLLGTVPIRGAGRVLSHWVA